MVSDTREGKSGAPTSVYLVSEQELKPDINSFRHWILELQAQPPLVLPRPYKLILTGSVSISELKPITPIVAFIRL